MAINIFSDRIDLPKKKSDARQAGISDLTSAVCETSLS
jgi:hypothetical protein